MEDTARENGLVYEMLPLTGLLLLTKPIRTVIFGMNKARSKKNCLFWYSMQRCPGEKNDKRVPFGNPSGEIDIALNVLGDHNIVNAICAAAVEYAVGRDLCDIKEGVGKFQTRCSSR